MTPEAQRIAIAEACGYTNVHKFSKWKEGQYRNEGDLVGDIAGHTKCFIPNYINDLNAIHEAEKTLIQQGQKTRYIYHLQTIGGAERFGDSYLATAAQRAEAFLRALGLWKEEGGV